MHICRQGQALHILSDKKLWGKIFSKDPEIYERLIRHLHRNNKLRCRLYITVEAVEYDGWKVHDIVNFRHSQLT